MKKTQILRFGVQLLGLVLTTIGFFVNYKITMGLILGMTILGGVFFCGWICPYGFIQDLFSKFGRTLGIKKRKMPKLLQKIMFFSRYLVLGSVILISTDLIFTLMSFDPRSNMVNLLLSNTVALGSIAVMAFFTLVALFFDRPFCNYLCYEGAKYGLIGSFKIFTVKRTHSTCVNCKKCDKACPMNIEVSKCNNLRSPQCINCLQCVSSCPVDGALKYGKIETSTKQKKQLTAIALLILVASSIFIKYTNDNGINLHDLIHHSKAVSDAQIEVTDKIPAGTMTSGIDSTPESPESPVLEEGSETAASTSGDTVTELSCESLTSLGDAAGIDDGKYTGEAYAFRGLMTVEVTVKDQLITNVKVIEHRDDRKWFNRANRVMPNRIIEAQSTEVDLVSGATYSARGIRDGVQNALANAK